VGDTWSVASEEQERVSCYCTVVEWELGGGTMLDMAGSV
jgi:hypothetical protein